MKYFLLVLTICSAALQAQPFSKIDTLKGSDTQYRNFWNVMKYELTVEPNFLKKTVSGENKISFEITKDVQQPTFQIDLQQPMQYQLIKSSEKNLTSKRDGDFIFITSKKNYKKGERAFFTLSFSGHPTEAENAPWDGGWVFSSDEKGNPWISVAQEGTGVSLWLPTKDIWSDEPEEGIKMTIISPKNLTGVGNGRLISSKVMKDKKINVWEVKNPINGYSIVPNIGKYVHFGEKYEGEKGVLDVDYWVLEDNLSKAQEQFKQVKPMLKAFEYWFGPYPFYEDSFKLIEVPYLGMEHQSGVAYGNGFKNGYLGRDLSQTGIGLLWDFIIIHESGHEWFANNITAKDAADLWIHEAFTCYSETLFTEHFLNRAAADTYLQGLRINIENKSPIIGKYGVRNEGSGDMYYKGASMLHTIRQIINDDTKFRQVLRGLNKDFYHQTVTTSQIEQYISSKSGIDFSSLFNQYLRGIKIPTLLYSQKGNTLHYRYTDGVKNLYLPLSINAKQSITPSAEWQKIELISDLPFEISKNYYINVEKASLKD